MRIERSSFGAPYGPANQIRVGDNLDSLAAQADRSIDMIYIDPPFATGLRRRGKQTPTSQPSFDDRMRDPERFVAWLRPRLEHTRRLLGDAGSLFVHLDHNVVHYVKVELDRIYGRQQFNNEIVWCYSVGGKSKRRFARKHDTILWYSRTASYSFYPDAVRVARKPKSHMRVKRDADGTLYQEKTNRKTGRVYRYPVERGKVPEDWWTDIETLNRGDRERTGYPTQKPERLLRRIIDATTVPGNCVGDFFSGSGTTGAVAQDGHRRFVLADANLEACQIAYKRLCRRGEKLAAAGSPPPDLVLSETPNQQNTVQQGRADSRQPSVIRGTVETSHGTR